MRGIKILPTLRQLVLISILFIIQFQKCFGESDSSSQSYYHIQSNLIIDLAQSQSAVTYQLDLQKNKMNFNRYIVVEININNIQIQTKFIPCINFDFDILRDEEFQKNGKLSCALSDNLKRIQQNQSYILVIDQQEPIYKNSKVIYLTIIVQVNQLQILNPSQKLSEPLKYNVFLYNFNSYPCNKDCNGNNGACDPTNGLCKCKPGFFDVDCGVQVYPLDLDDMSFTASFYIQANKLYFYRIQMNEINQKSKRSDVVLNIKKFNFNSQLNIQLLLNKEQLPTDDNYYLSYKMNSEELTLPDINQLCQNQTSSFNSTNQNIDDQLNNSTSQDCFAIISIKQLTSTESSIITFSQKIIKSVHINNSNNHDNQNNNHNSNSNSQNKQQNQTNTQNNIKQQSNQESVNTTFIILITCLAAALFVPIAIRIIYLQCKKAEQPVQEQISVINNSQHQIPVQAISDIANRIKSGLKNKILNGKKRLLQDKLMPASTYHVVKSSQISISNLDKVAPCYDNSKNKEEITNQIQKDNEMYKENGDQQSQKLNQDDHSILDKNQNSQCILDNNKNNNQNNDVEKQLNKNNQSMSFTSVGNRQCCAICLTEFINEEQVRETICNHTFHMKCLSNWLNKNDSCPLCRQSFEIMHMIDYLAKFKAIKKNTYYERNKIQTQRDKIYTTLSEQKDEICDMSEEDFLNIFTYFLPKNQQEQNVVLTTQNDNQERTSNDMVTQQPVENTVIQNEQTKNDDTTQSNLTNCQKSNQIQQQVQIKILSPQNNNNQQKLPSSTKLFQNFIQSPIKLPQSQKNSIQQQISSPQSIKNQYFGSKKQKETESKKEEHKKINDAVSVSPQTVSLTAAIYGENQCLKEKQQNVKNIELESESIQNSPRLENTNDETGMLDSYRVLNNQRLYSVSKNQEGMSKDFSIYEGGLSNRESSTSQHLFIQQNDDSSPISLFNKFVPSQFDEIKEGQILESLTDRQKEQNNNHKKPQKDQKHNNHENESSVNKEESVQHNEQRNVTRRKQFLQNLQQQQIHQ